MNFTAPAASLTAALRLAAAATSRKSPMPILSCVRLAVDGKRLTISGTDLTISVEATCAVTAPKNGTAVVNAKDLLDLIAAFEESVTVAVDASVINVTSGKKIRARLPLVQAKDFPRMPSMNGATMMVEVAPFRTALDLAAIAVCGDETRFHLCGVFVDGDRYIATDGHRMHVLTGPKIGANALIPARGVAEIVRAIADVDACEVLVTEKMIHVQTDAATVSVQLVDAQFPPWRQVAVVIDGKGRKTATVERSALVSAMNRARRYSTDTGVAVRLMSGGDTMSIVARHERGEYDEEIDLATPWEGETIKIGLRPAYVIEACRTSTDETAAMSIGGELDAVGVFGGVNSATVMPTRLA